MLFGKDDSKPVASYSLFPLREIVVFPHMVVPLNVGRERSIAALNDAVAKKGPNKNAQIVLATQKNAKVTDPGMDDVFHTATLANIIQLLPLPGGQMKVLVEGVRRVKVKAFLECATHFLVEVDEFEDAVEEPLELSAMVRLVHTSFEQYLKLNKRLPPELLQQVTAIDDAAWLADTVAAHLPMKDMEARQHVLELASAKKRLEKLYEMMQQDISILQVQRKIRSRVKDQMERSQKEYYLNEQMQAIQRELGEKEDSKSEIQELEDRLKSKKMSKEATTKVKKEIKKLRMMGPMSAEASVVRNYIDWVLSLPWNEETKDSLDITAAENVLDEDHHGLKKVKERILEFLAVRALVAKTRGPILCFVGPPGVGKTSLAKSIAKSLGRKFVRMSLGGVRDEAEIRGHRRTYIGAMPGKLIQSMKKAESNNPVILLDEIDKMSTDFRGDPSSALLEVLDPEQNNTFNDHYLDMDYDLSKVMFICTANSLHSIPSPLLDRMEVVRLAGYTEDEKMAIARKYLIPKQREANGLKDIPLECTPTAVRTIINRYTRESGVRSLEREISSVFRKLARDVVKNGTKELRVDRKRVMSLLGPTRYRYGTKEREDQVGIVTGLAVMDSGGDTLTVEASLMPGKGKLTITGKLGEVMQESAQAALTYVRARAARFGIDDKIFETKDIHIHVPEGAIPKDGPSAGIALATALVSSLTRVPVRRDVAMTGEVTLRGRVLPIGGLKEKVLAAHRAGIKTVIFPEENRKDLRDIPKKVRVAMKLVPVEFVDDVLREALVLDKPEDFFKSPSVASIGASGPSDSTPVPVS